MITATSTVKKSVGHPSAHRKWVWQPQCVTHIGLASPECDSSPTEQKPLRSGCSDQRWLESSWVG